MKIFDAVVYAGIELDPIAAGPYCVLVAGHEWLADRGTLAPRSQRAKEKAKWSNDTK
jgi:hypothetical protein